MQIEGVRWTAIRVDQAQLDGWKKLAATSLGMKVVYEQGGFLLLSSGDGGLVELYGPGSPAESYLFEHNDVVVGFRVDDIEKASAELQAAGLELLGAVKHEGANYAYRHFRGPDGRVYGLNSQHGSR